MYVQDVCVPVLLSAHNSENMYYLSKIKKEASRFFFYAIFPLGARVHSSRGMTLSDDLLHFSPRAPCAAFAAYFLCTGLHIKRAGTISFHSTGS